MKKFFENVWYFIRCWFVRNPNNPSAPTLWDLKPGTKITILRKGTPVESFVVKKVYLEIANFDGNLKFKAKVEGTYDYKSEIYLSDRGIIPYMERWNDFNVPYLG